MSSKVPSINSSAVAPNDSVDVAQLIWRKVSLDTIPWLDLKASGTGIHVALEVHNKLLASLRSTAVPGCTGGTSVSSGKVQLGQELDRVRSQLIPALNDCTLAVLEEAWMSIDQLSEAKVTYKIRDSDGSDSGEIILKCALSKIPFLGDPLGAVANMLAIRTASSDDQWNAIELLIAIQRLSDAKIALGTAERDRLTSVAWRRRQLEQAEKKLAILRQRVDDDLQALVSDTLVCFQFYAPGIFPVALALPDKAKKSDFGIAASAYENLARELRQPFDWLIYGSARHVHRAEQGWQQYLACGIAFRVIVAWLRALENLNPDDKRCQYCYRHRMLKLRCGEHPSKFNDSLEARKGRAIYPIYVDLSLKLSEDSGVRNALGASLVVSAADWLPILLERRAKRIPKVLRRSVAILVVQIRRIQAVLGPRFEDKARRLFLEMEEAATKAVTTTITDKASKRRSDEAPYLMNLKNFLKLWFGLLGSEVSATFPELKALGYDPYHSVVKTGNFLESDVASDLLRQRAWFEAEAQFSDETSSDRKRAIDLHNDSTPHSLREIGRMLGYSHETVRRFISDAPDRKYQKLKPNKRFA